MHVSAIIVAGGFSKRLSGTVPKILRLIGERTLLQRSIEPFDRSTRINEIILVLPSKLVTSPPKFLQTIQTPLQLVPGGKRRQDSVAAGFDLITSGSDIVVVHDAARPFCTTALISKTIAAAWESGAAIAGLSIHDTVKEGRLEKGLQFVESTLDRDRIFLAQTPQAFRFDVLREAVLLSSEDVEVTDEAMLAEQAGYRVRIVQGESRNVKITTPADLSLACEMVTAGKTCCVSRVGLGYDLHRLVDGRPLILGGVHIPGKRGLLGHSDADAICHAVTDAVLGAAGAGDIGKHFPDNDERWKDFSSIELLRQAIEIVRDSNYVVRNVDIVVIAEKPKILDYSEKMQQKLADVLEVAPTQVSIKGKTGEGVGEIGRGEVIVVHAIALLHNQN